MLISLGRGWAQEPQLCTQINLVTGYKIVLDDIRFSSGAANEQDKQLMNLLNFQLRSRLENLDDEVTVRYHLIRCNGRLPEGEASFPPLTMSGLVNRDVVLEIWGEIFGPAAGTQRVFLNYVMIPLSSGTVSPFLQRTYTPKAGSTPDEIVDWLANLNELGAYARVARAVRLLSIKGPEGYDSAKADLETASSDLRHAFAPSPTASQKELLAFVTKRKCEVMQDARTNADYKGPLRLVPDTILRRECPTGGNL
jgi:hypothetical protein